jgi:hypothetical protein
LACSPVADNRSYGQRLAAEQLAFVGTVTAVQARKVTFVVAPVFAGSAEGKKTIQAAEPSTCAISFQVGQRWVYAGNFTTSPSVLLKTAASGPLGGDGGRLVRLDDARIGPRPEWQTCQSNAECVAVPAGCGHTAANIGNAGAAGKRAVAVLGDHGAMECATKDGVVSIGAQCVSSRCGNWVLDLNIRP